MYLSDCGSGWTWDGQSSRECRVCTGPKHHCRGSHHVVTKPPVERESCWAAVFHFALSSLLYNAAARKQIQQSMCYLHADRVGAKYTPRFPMLSFGRRTRVPTRDRLWRAAGLKTHRSTATILPYVIYARGQ